jgi:hypothetical protein
MTTTLTPVTDRATPPPPLARRAQHRATRWGLFSDLEEPRQIVANLTPNWLASVMGTGIAATGALLIPYAPAGQVRLCLLLCCYAMFGISLIGPSAPSARTYRSA